MAVCGSCGLKIVDGTEFCEHCGCEVVNEATVNEGRSQQEYVGVVYKCPNCGEALQSFVAYCPTCGFELRGAKATNAVRELQAKLEVIESGRESIREDQKPKFFEKFFKSNNLSTTDEQKVSLIRSFAIPNTKEDITEFIILAVSNIEVNIYDRATRLFEVQYDARRALSDAWLAKLEQAYQKAKLVFGDSSDFQSIHNAYEETNKKINREKKKGLIKGIGLLILGVIAIINFGEDFIYLAGLFIALIFIIVVFKLYQLLFKSMLKHQKLEYLKLKEKNIAKKNKKGWFS